MNWNERNWSCVKRWWAARRAGENCRVSGNDQRHRNLERGSVWTAVYCPDPTRPSQSGCRSLWDAYGMIPNGLSERERIYSRVSLVVRNSARNPVNGLIDLQSQREPQYSQNMKKTEKIDIIWVYWAKLSSIINILPLRKLRWKLSSVLLNILNVNQCTCFDYSVKRIVFWISDACCYL